jgi:hypothetical protein
LRGFDNYRYQSVDFVAFSDAHRIAERLEKRPSLLIDQRFRFVMTPSPFGAPSDPLGSVVITR